MISYNELVKLGFSSDTYSEILLTVRLGSDINVAPIGVLMENQELIIRVFKGSKTYNMLLNGAKECVINVTRNPRYFYYAIFHKDKIMLTDAVKVSVKRVADCNAYIECNISNIELKDDYLTAYLKPIFVEISSYYPLTFNRAWPAIIEALVHYTKIPYYRSLNISANEIIRKISFLREIVYRSSKNIELRRIIDDIIDRTRKLLEGK